jgi:hypothetical protein
MALRLKKFDMRKLRHDSVVVLLGKRNTGKSFLTRDILYHHRDIPIGTIISPTEMANKFYSSLVPKFFIHDEYSPGLVDRVVRRQRQVVEKEEDDKTIDPRAFLVFDDCLYDDSWKRDKNIRMLFMNGRHWKMLFLITMQFPLGIPPVLRSNVDFVFILRETITSNRKRIHDHWAGMFPSYNFFSDVMDQCTENFECLVIDNTVKSNKIQDQVYWYKAAAHEDFRLGAPILWRMSARYPQNAKKKKAEAEDPTAFMAKKKLGFRVQKLT